MNIDVSIIVLNYRARNLIKEQLRHFLSQQTKCLYEVIVVDNDSGDGIQDVLAKDFPGVTFIQTGKNRGYAAGNNAALRVAGGRYCLIVNPDIVLTAEAVDRLFTFMEAHPRVGLAGPMLTNADGSLQYSCLRFPTVVLPFMRRTPFARTAWGKRWLASYFMEDWDHAAARDGDWLFGAFLMARRKAVDEVGMLDEQFFLYMEDTDWCRRFWQHGWAVYYVPEAKLIHLLRRSSEGSLWSIASNPLARVHLGSFFRYTRKYFRAKNPHSGSV